MSYFQELVEQACQEDKSLATYGHDLNLQQVQSAFNNSSFNPEKRAISVMQDYAQRIADFKSTLENRVKTIIENGYADGRTLQDLQPAIIETLAAFRSKLLAAFNTYISRESQCASWAVTGPARFPVARNQKRMASAQNAYDEISSLSDKFLKRAIKEMFPNGDGSQISSMAANAEQQLIAKIDSLKATQEHMKNVNKILRKYLKNCPAEELLTRRHKAAAEIALAGLLSEDKAFAISDPKRFQGAGYAQFSLNNNRQNMKRYEDRLADLKKNNELEDSNELTGEIENGIRYTVMDARIAIFFPEKPDEEMRKLLRKHAFKFSPSRNNAWVRQLTNNAKFSFIHYVLPQLAA